MSFLFLALIDITGGPYGSHEKSVGPPNRQRVCYDAIKKAGRKNARRRSSGLYFKFENRVQISKLGFKFENKL